MCFAYKDLQKVYHTPCSPSKRISLSDRYSINNTIARKERVNIHICIGVLSRLNVYAYISTSIYIYVEWELQDQKWHVELVMISAHYHASCHVVSKSSGFSETFCNVYCLMWTVTGEQESKRKRDRAIIMMVIAIMIPMRVASMWTEWTPIFIRLRTVNWVAYLKIILKIFLSLQQ